MTEVAASALANRPLVTGPPTRDTDGALSNAPARLAVPLMVAKALPL